MGKSGSARRILQEQLSVKIIVPVNVSRDQQTNVKVTIAGPRMKVSEAKKMVKELVKHHHCDITHPGQIHLEMDVPQTLYNCIIGTKGNEIRQIQNSYKVSVYLPSEHALVRNVLIVGEPTNVENAQRHIQKILDQANRDRDAVGVVADTWAGATGASTTTAAPASSAATNDSLLLSRMPSALDSLSAAPWMADLVQQPVVGLARSNPPAGASAVSGGWGAASISSAEGW